MKLLPAHYCAAGLLVLLIALPASAQKGGSQGSAPSQPSTAGPVGQPGGTQPINPQSQAATFAEDE